MRNTVSHLKDNEKYKSKRMYKGGHVKKAEFFINNIRGFSWNGQTEYHEKKFIKLMNSLGEQEIAEKCLKEIIDGDIHGCEKALNFIVLRYSKNVWLRAKIGAGILGGMIIINQLLAGLTSLIELTQPKVKVSYCDFQALGYEDASLTQEEMVKVSEENNCSLIID